MLPIWPGNDCTMNLSYSQRHSRLRAILKRAGVPSRKVTHPVAGAQSARHGRGWR